MKTWNIEDISKLCAECGAIALKHYDRPGTQFKADETVVTEADTEIERLLAVSFDRPGEGAYMIGEETVGRKDDAYIDNALAGTAWVVDPIDGTAMYANHLPGWGVSIGLVERGALTQGAVYFPLTGELIATDGGSVIISNVPPAPTDGEPTNAGPQNTHGAKRDAARRVLPRLSGDYSRGAVIAITQEIARGPGVPIVNPIIAAGSAVFPLTEMAQGHVIGYVGALKLWDIAGSLAILLALGALVHLEDGTEVGARVDDGTYNLGAQVGVRWKSRGRFLIANAPATHRYIDEAVQSYRARI